MWRIKLVVESYLPQVWGDETVKDPFPPENQAHIWVGG